MANTRQGGVGDGRRLRGGAINAEPEATTPACVPEWHARLRDGRTIRQGQKPNEELPREVPNFQEEERSPGPELRSQLPRHRRYMLSGEVGEGLMTITEVTSSRESPPTQERVDTPPPDADEPARSIPSIPRLSWDRENPGDDPTPPPATVGVIPYHRTVQDTQAGFKGFLKLRQGDELKLAHPEVKGRDGEYYFYGKKVQDASQGWFPVPCLEASEGDLGDLEDEWMEERDWEQFTDPLSLEPWFWRKSTEEYFFPRLVREWRKAIDPSSESGVWWCHQGKKRFFKQPKVPELEEDLATENPQDVFKLASP